MLGLACLTLVDVFWVKRLSIQDAMSRRNGVAPTVIVSTVQCIAIVMLIAPTEPTKFIVQPKVFISFFLIKIFFLVYILHLEMMNHSSLQDDVELNGLLPLGFLGCGLQRLRLEHKVPVRQWRPLSGQVASL